MESDKTIIQANKPWKYPRGGNRGLTQAYVIRDLAVQSMDRLKAYPVGTLEEELSRAQAFRCLGAVWKDASDRIRILRGRPLPGSLKPVPRARKAPRPLAPSTEEP